MTSSDLAERLGAGEGDELLRDPARRGELFALDAFPAGCTNPELGHAVLCELDLLAIGAGSPGLEPHLAECAACAAEEADAKASLEDLEAPATTPQVGLRCIYCHDGLEVASAAYCASCLAVHHAECFQEHGTCAAPGCGEAHWVRRSAAQPIQPLAAPSRLRGLWQAAAVLLVSALVAGGAYLDYAYNSREEARLEALRQADAAREAEREVKRKVAKLEAEVQRLVLEQQYAKARALLERFPESLPPRILTLQPAEHMDRLELLVRDLQRAEEDTRRFDAAMETIRARNEDGYPVARIELGAISPRSTGIYPDARAYLGWLEGQDLESRARDALLQGKGGRALLYLGQALKGYRVDVAGVTSGTESLLSKSAQSATRLASTWESGFAAFQRAESEIGNDRLERARLDLLMTLEHLPEESPQAKQAQRYLDQLESLRKNADARLLYQRRRDGFERSVKRQDWRSAHHWATQLVQAHKIEMDWLIEIARRAEEKLAIFQSAEKILEDEAAPHHLLLWAKDVFVFLAAWLPPNDPKVTLSELHLRKLLVRIGAEKSAEESPVDDPEVEATPTPTPSPERPR
jgi:hypothetical protein